MFFNSKLTEKFVCKNSFLQNRYCTASFSKSPRYKSQDRGASTAYASYIKEMNASMWDKIAIMASHIPSYGRVADMGTGSGLGSYHLASLYPQLKVTGVDINPEMVKQAKKQYKKANLKFVVGDIAKKCLAEPQDAIINCSVLHHVTSFNHYKHRKAQDALREQKKQLVDQGVIILRDFVDPGSQDVLLDLPADSEDVPLFLRFTREFRSLHKHPGCAYQELVAPEGIRRFQLSHKLANEFILRKDYKRDWNLEIQEEYTYGTIEELQKIFQDRLGLRILSATNLRNPWIISNRYQGKCALRNLEGKEIDYPATNCIVVGQKVKKGEGIAFLERKEAPVQDYLKMTHFQNEKTGKIFDLVRRPGLTIDIIPFYEQDGHVYIMALRHYPRPILGCNQDNPLVDGSHAAAYITEPLNVQKQDLPPAQTIEQTLQKYGTVSIKKFLKGTRVFPSPGGIQEEIVSRLIEISPVNSLKPQVHKSGFSTSGTLSAIEAQQLLRASQVGALRDARLEMNIYCLFQTLNIKSDPWIGEKISLQEGPAIRQFDLTMPFSRRVFKEVKVSANFLQLRSSNFVEKDSARREIASKSLEYVIPRDYSINTIAVAVLCKYKGEVFIGVDDDDRPAAQCFDGHSNILVTPAWRLPKNISGIKDSRSWIVNRLFEEYGLVSKAMWNLGASYHPSPGVTPEVVIPLAAEVREKPLGSSTIKWISLKTLLESSDQIVDGHLHILMLRAAHALNLT